MRRRPAPGDVVLGALALVLLASTLGLARNHVSRYPLPLLTAWKAPAPRGVVQVSVEEARTLLESGAVFVDARETVRYDEGHVPGALNLPADELEDSAPARGADPLLLTLRVAPAVVVYCDGPECRASDRVARRLVEKGLRNVRTMPEGWPAWEAAGYPSVSMP